jgi:hypothetical protein
MRRLMRFAAGLYPAAWRERYGEEFEALLEDIGPGWRDVWNVLGGALKMQMVTWSFWKLVPALGLAGAAIMAVAVFTIRPVYESSAVMGVMATTDRAAVSRLAEVAAKRLNRAALSEIAVAERLYPGERLEDGVARMRRNVRISLPSAQGGKTAALIMSFRYPDPIKAQHVVQRLVARYKGEALDPASLPCRPVYPNRAAMIAVGIMAGLALGLVAVGLRRKNAAKNGGIAG